MSGTTVSYLKNNMNAHEHISSAKSTILLHTIDKMSAQLCPTLCNPKNSSPPGSSVHGILWARILEWVAISFSRDLSDPGIKLGSLALQADSLPSEPPGSRRIVLWFIYQSSF